MVSSVTLAGCSGLLRWAVILTPLSLFLLAAVAVTVTVTVVPCISHHFGLLLCLLLLISHPP
jgi:hypothetical protein